MHILHTKNIEQYRVASTTLESIGERIANDFVLRAHDPADTDTGGYPLLARVNDSIETIQKQRYSRMNRKSEVIDH
jgi:hypothetical protein